MSEIRGLLSLSEDRVIPIVFGTVILAWSANWPVMKFAIEHIAPTWLAAVRFLITVVAVSLPVIALGRFRLPRRSELPLLLAVGTLQMAAFTFLSANALRFLPAGSASVVAYSTPLWVAPAAALILRERIGVGGVLATLFGLAGIAALAARLFYTMCRQCSSAWECCSPRPLLGQSSLLWRDAPDRPKTVF